MNLDKSTQKGSHWVAVNIEWGPNSEQSIDYYDSYGRMPTESFMRELKEIVDKIDPPIYLKFKYNRIVDQRLNSANCGYFAIKFWLQRYEGMPFKIAVVSAVC